MLGCRASRPNHGFLGGLVVGDWRSALEQLGGTQATMGVDDDDERMDGTGRSRSF